MSKTAVVIDDEAHIRQMIILLLTDLGVNVVGDAGTGAEGLALIEAKQPDLVLLDVHLPDMLGNDVLLKTKASLKKVKVIILSAINDQAKVEELANQGADYYIIKNNQPEQISHLLKTMLDFFDEKQGHEM